MKKKFLSILAIILALAILGSCVGTAFLLKRQPKAKVNDKTEKIEEQQDDQQSAAPPALDDNEIYAVFNPNLHLITAEDAVAVNLAIHDISYFTTGIQFQVKKGTRFSDLGVGDVFYLEGGEHTPLAQTYIGKIDSVIPTGDGASYFVTMPTIDEVFDDLHFSTQQVLNSETIDVFQAAEGVTLNRDPDGSHSSSTSRSTEDPAIVELTEDFGGDVTLKIDFELDLLELLKLKEEKPKNESVPHGDLSGTTVYTTKHGQCYHKENCPSIKNSKEKYEHSLAQICMDKDEAGKQKYRACKRCDPPVPEDYDFEPELTLSGNLGFDKLTLTAACDWTIADGFDNLSVSADGDFVANATLKSSLELDLSSETTEIDGKILDFQGLKKKTFPLAFVGINTTFTPVTAAGNVALDAATSAVPLTVGAMLYVDISGNVSVTGSVSLEYTRAVHADYVLFKDGECVNKLSFEKGENDLTFTLEAEAAFEADAHFGTSALLYIFNVNIVELAVFKIGAETEGSVAMSYTHHFLSHDDTQTGERTVPPDNFETSGHVYLRLYLKLCELNVNISISATLYKDFGFDLSYEYSKALMDLTIWQIGTPKPSRYNDTTMSYSHITAKSGDTLFYKDLDGALMRKDGAKIRSIYSEEFFAICGIDQSYIYLMVPTGSAYDIVRVDLEGGASRTILTNVANLLMQDESYLYYTSASKTQTVRRLDRATLKDTVYYEAEDPVQSLHTQEDGYYLTTGEVFGIFVSCYHYLLNPADGTLIADYGDEPEPQFCQLRDQGSFYAAVMTSSAGYPRSTASAVYWLSADKSTYVKTETTVGWDYMDVGLLTVQQASMDGCFQAVVLYRAADGVRQNLFGVHHGDALFTLKRADNGTWYYLDQTDDSIILYSMNSDFTNRQVVKTYDRSAVPFDLDTCSAVLVDNTLFFYSMPSNSQCTVIDRYNLK